MIYSPTYTPMPNFKSLNQDQRVAVLMAVMFLSWATAGLPALASVVTVPVL